MAGKDGRRVKGLIKERTGDGNVEGAFFFLYVCVREREGEKEKERM